VLILDEPTSGLDPNQIVEIRNLIRQLGRAKNCSAFHTHTFGSAGNVPTTSSSSTREQSLADGTLEQLQQDFRGSEKISLELKAVQPMP